MFVSHDNCGNKKKKETGGQIKRERERKREREKEWGREKERKEAKE